MSKTAHKRLVYPFSAIVNMDKLKLAILINAINPKIGGLLIRGPKGSGKTTIVRSLTDILPKIHVIKNCPFNCSPDDRSNACPLCMEKYANGREPEAEEKDMTVVDLPLGATEDRVIGSLDVEKAIKQGIKALEPGILAEANQNVLYVDEVNLLPDHIADDLLDAAATGWNVVEREGISVSHPARFIFVGTMNPEEGELRPQLLDRFPLSVIVGTIESAEDRVAIVKRNIDFEADPERFHEEWKATQDELRNRMSQAKAVLKSVVIPDGILRSISQACLELKVDGLRPDIVIAKSAATLAAFENRKEVTLNDVLVAAELALSHRTRQGGFVEPASPKEISETFTAAVKKLYQFEKLGETSKQELSKKGFLKGKTAFYIDRDATKEEQEKKDKKSGLTKKAEDIRLKITMFISRFAGGYWTHGKRMTSKPQGGKEVEGLPRGSNQLKGFSYENDDEEKKKSKMKAIPIVGDTIRSAEPTEGSPIMVSFGKIIRSPSSFFLNLGKVKVRHQGVYAGRRAQVITTLQRGRPYSWRVPHGKPSDIHLPATIRQAALHHHQRRKTDALAVRIGLDDVREKLRSGKAPLTMVFVVDLSGSMMLNVDPVREALLGLHSDAYRCRDKVGIVALKDFGAVVVQHPITNLRVVANKLVNMRISGFTPLASGMLKALDVLKEARRRTPETIPSMVVITDGSANIPLAQDLETGETRHIEVARAATREYEDISMKDVFLVAKMVKREGVKVIVVNTNAHMYGRETYGFEVTERLARITSGTHHAIGTLTTQKEMVNDMIESIREDQRTIVAEKRSVFM